MCNMPHVILIDMHRLCMVEKVLGINDKVYNLPRRENAPPT